MDETKDIIEKIKKETEKVMCEIAEEGLDLQNIETLYKAVDIHKDLANEEYWEKKKEVMSMRYRGYGEYGRDSRRGSYNEGSYQNYGRRSRDSRGRYRGDDMMEEMHEHYRGYSEQREEYGRSGNYGAKEDSMMSLEYMLQSMVDFVEMLQQEAENQEEVNLIRKYTKKISEM